MIRKLEAQDIDAAVCIHLASFPNFFLSFLGPRFLELFYRSFLEDSAGIGFVTTGENGSVLGIVVGPLVPAGYFKRLLKRRWWMFCLASASAILRRPWIVSRLLQALWYRGDAPEKDNVPRALLSSIAVAPIAQGRGIGQKLVTTWLSEVQRRGGKGAFLTTDAEGNEVVNAFYHRLGWELDSSYSTAQGRRMNRYTYDFREPT